MPSDFTGGNHQLGTELEKLYEVPENARAIIRVRYAVPGDIDSTFALAITRGPGAEPKAADWIWSAYEALAGESHVVLVGEPLGPGDAVWAKAADAETVNLHVGRQEISA